MAISRNKARDKAAEAAERAQREGESDADYAARIAALDAEENGEDAAKESLVNPGNDGMITVRAVSGFTHHSGGPTAEDLEKMRTRLDAESDDAYAARIKKFANVQPGGAPIKVERGMALRVTPEDGARLGRLGLVLIGRSSEVVADTGPKVLSEAGLIQTNAG